jgi:hypothetical protein
MAEQFRGQEDAGDIHGTLQNLRINGKIPYTKVGRLMFHKREDIVRMLESGVSGK